MSATRLSLTTRPHGCVLDLGYVVSCLKWNLVKIKTNDPFLSPSKNFPEKMTRPFDVVWSIYFFALPFHWLILVEKNWSILHFLNTVVLLIIIRNVYVSFVFFRQWTIDRFVSLLLFSRSSHWSILILIVNGYCHQTLVGIVREECVMHAVSHRRHFSIVLLIIVEQIWFGWRQLLSTWCRYKWVNRLRSINFSKLPIHWPMETIESQWHAGVREWARNESLPSSRSTAWERKDLI